METLTDPNALTVVKPAEVTVKPVNIASRVNFLREQGFYEGIDFDVVKYPVLFAPDTTNTLKEVENSFVTVRQDTKEALGIVSSRYSILDHRENLARMFDIVHEAGYKPEVAHRVSGGVVTSRFLLDNDFLPGGDKREGARAIIDVRNSYDGCTRYDLTFGVWRKICSNGMFGFRDAFAFSRKHTQGIQYAAIDVITMLKDSVEECKRMYIDFLIKLKDNRPVDKKVMVDGGIPARLVKHAEERFPNEEQTAWGMYNAFTYILSHNTKMREDVRRQAYAAVGRFFLAYYVGQQVRKVNA